MPWWRWSLLALVTLLFVAWTAVAAVNLLAAVTKDCAEAASEISDPCAMGRGMDPGDPPDLGCWSFAVGLRIGMAPEGAQPDATPAREDG